MFLPRTRVLVVEDHPLMRRLICAALIPLGLTDIEEAEDAADALPLIETAAKGERPFGLIISDWNMPKMLGIDLLRRVRANPLTARTPFVIVTAETRESYLTEATVAGVSGFLNKPFIPSSFEEKLQDVYRKHFKG